MTRRVGTSVALVALTAVLAGCAVGPNYERPVVTAPEQVRGASAAEAASLADRPWWEVFGDDALKSLIDEALKNNYDIREATWRVQEFRARAGVARADFYPQVQYQGQVSRSKESGFVLPGSTAVTLYDVNLGLSWEIDLWGRIRRLSESALAQYLATEEARRGVLLSTVADVARAYFALRELDARLEIARRTTDTYGETLDLFSRQLAGGIASQLEVSRAEGSMRIAAGAVSDLERQIVAQENLIGFLLGRNPGPVTRGASLTGQALVPEIPAGLPSALLERRPDIRQAEQQLVAANADVGAAMASFFPTISLTGAFGAVSTDVSTLFPAGRTWSIAAGLTGPLFQGMRLKNQYDVNVALFEEARVRYESAVTNAFGEVSTALVAYQKLALTEKELAGSVAAFQEAVRLANIRYVAGLANYVEVLDAEQQLFPAELALAQTRFQRLDSFVQLYRALGGGWNIADPAWTRQASAAPAAN
jgi:multidrug efflux system outer membrane protein